MSVMVWCDVHGGAFPGLQAGSSHLQVSIYLPDGRTNVRERHACKKCTEKMFDENVEIKALEKGQDSSDDWEKGSHEED